jgi:ligand-binding SRPBCC domain-containing protein
LTAQVLLPRPVDEAFLFFADAGNLDRITPPWLRFEILTSRPIAMQVCTRIDYRLRVRRFPVRWQSEITAWEPPHRFVNEHRRGPYRLWHHEHTFAECDGGTVFGDRVRYAVWGGALVNRLFVQRDVAAIFGYRQQTLRELLA